MTIIKYSRVMLFFVVCMTVLLAKSAWTEDFNPLSSAVVEDDFDNWDFEAELDFQTEDPFESFNRLIFGFNDKMITHVFFPLSRLYDFVVPDRIQGSIHNFFYNVQMPRRVFNNLFQKKGRRAGVEFGRFFVNMTLGLGGFFNPAEAAFNLKSYDEDFGQTLGFYGVQDGPYLMWPFFGPSNRRDTIGFFGDMLFNPFTWLGVFEVDPQETIRILGIVRTANNFSYNLKDVYRTITDDALDPYIALQYSYIKNRHQKINQ